MIVTTTQTVEGRQIAEYKGIVFGEERVKKLLTKCASVPKD